MALLIPDFAPTEKLPESKEGWQEIYCELVTPLHGGGVVARESDEKLPVRVTAIRGQLRFWWRFLAHQKWNLSGKRLREAEFRLWGGIGEEAAASLVFLRVQVQNKLQEASLSDYAKGLNDPLGYVLFTARKTKTGLPEMKLGKEGLRWMVQWCLSEKANETDKQQVLETLRWWVTLGGLGGRTRRGCGVFMAEGVEPVSTDEMCELGCKILFSGSDKKVKDAWIDAITEWKETRRKHKAEFRQLLGRNDEHSRHLATIFSRPVYESGQWHGMVIMLPNSSPEVKQILEKTK